MYLLTLISVYATLFPCLASSNPLESNSSPNINNNNAHRLIHPRQTTTDEEAYLNSVCQPNVTNPVPPCQEIINIQSGCTPNGTTPLAYLAHQECMCNGGFFSNWLGCLNCLYVHGGRSQAQSIAFSEILTSASNMLCTGTPTNSFAAIFSSLSDANVVGASTAGTGMTDLFPSQTAVSLYYTASGPQGEGQITGSATLATVVPSATAAASTSAVTAAATTTAVGGTSAGGSGGGSSSAASTTSSSGAAATSGLSGLLCALAGGVVFAAL